MGGFQGWNGRWLWWGEGHPIVVRVGEGEKRLYHKRLVDGWHFFKALEGSVRCKMKILAAGEFFW